MTKIFGPTLAIFSIAIDHFCSLEVILLYLTVFLESSFDQGNQGFDQRK